MWIDGIHETAPPDGFQDYFGAAPWHRHVKFEASSFLKRIRQFPQEQGAEDSMRFLLAGEQLIPAESLTEALDRIFKILEDDPEITVSRRHVIAVHRTEMGICRRLIICPTYRVSLAIRRDP